MVKRIRARNIGPVREADVRFGDLTVFVGPQATGKSIFLQILKLLRDKRAIHETMQRFGMAWRNDFAAFLDLYLGEGMSAVWSPEESRLRLGNSSRDTDFGAYARGRRSANARESMFYIPAQRVMSLRDGMTRPFSDYRAGDPFVLRDFSDKLHWIVQTEIGLESDIFPRERRLNMALRGPLVEHIFGGFDLRSDASGHQNRLVLQRSGNSPLPYSVWSAGQREFVPLLLGLYWLLPPAATPRRNEVEWVVVEEPETGLHPNAINAVLNLVLELLRREYRVCLSTHSPHVLDIVWALRFFQENGGTARDVTRLLNLPLYPATRGIAEAALNGTLNTYYFARDGRVLDISELDPGSEDAAQSGWGGLTEFSGHAGDIVAEVANRSATRE